METASVSTVNFKSNIQIISAKSIDRDEAFLSCVRNIFALEEMQRLRDRRVIDYQLTSIQKDEMQHAAVHCVYAAEGDYPWGTVVDEFGHQSVVCKCTNTVCHHFQECRPDFDPEELKAAGENALFQEKAEAARASIQEEPVPPGLETDDFSAQPQLFTVPNQQEAETDAAPASVSDIESFTSGQEKLQFSSEDDKTDTGLFGNQSEGAAEDVSGEQLDIFQALPPRSAEKAEPDIPDASFSSFRCVEQSEILCLDPEERTIVNAGPGTGKTWALIEKLKYMLQEQNVDPENILVLCFSRAAVEVIRTRLEDAAGRDELPLNWHLIDVRTFDSFATFLIAWLLESEPERLPAGCSLEGAGYDERIRMAAAVLRDYDDILMDYEHIIVDEVQDLVGARAEMVLHLLNGLPETCGFTILGDSCQAIYDYLADNDASVMSSSEFYKRIFHDFRHARFLSLEKNYRQKSELASLTLPYRTAILSGDADAQTEALRELNNAVSTSAVDLAHFSGAEKYTEQGTLGILTRTNGQALQISAWLRAQDIPHVLQRPAGSAGLGNWIFRVLSSAQTDVIDSREFSKIFSELYPGNRLAEKYWNALISTQRNQTQRHYEIEDLLKGLLQNSRNPALYGEPDNDRPAITVSNIHRAKGREFDTVLVSEDVMKNLTDGDSDDEPEHRVCYVALTRPRKAVEKVQIKNRYIQRMKNESGRCFRSGMSKKHYPFLSHFEIGQDTDLDLRSFAVLPEVQEYLQNSLMPGTGLKLLKCPEGTNAYITYCLVPEENPGMTLGYTTKEFVSEMEKAMQQIFKSSRRIDYKYFQEIFSDIYLDGLITCVSADGRGIPAARQFGQMYMWNAPAVSGLARRENTRY